ncbi:rhodanese-like domain-containing protein [bacterium]|nr:MAG: rhodanese-like domain-containing protein [bacterium]
MKSLLKSLIIAFFLSVTLHAQDTGYHVFLKALYEKFNVDHISADSLSKLLTFDSVVVLDTRSENEYLVSHIHNARWIDFDTFDFAKMHDISKSSRIITYCSVGYRSSVIAERLTSLGYLNVQNLFGGIFEWVNQEYPVFREGTETTDIHPYNNFWGKWLRHGNKVSKPRK